MFRLVRTGLLAALGEVIGWLAVRYAWPAPWRSVGQEGGGRAGDERPQDGQAGLEVGDDAAVRSQELSQLAAVFGLIQDDRCCVGFVEREQFITQALGPALQGRARPGP